MEGGRRAGWEESLKVLIDDARSLIGPFSLYGRLHTTMAKTMLQGGVGWMGVGAKERALERCIYMKRGRGV